MTFSLDLNDKIALARCANDNMLTPSVVLRQLVRQYIHEQSDTSRLGVPSAKAGHNVDL